ncbi:septation protein sun4 [Pestalotiopsis sp. IQ-011]
MSFLQNKILSMAESREYPKTICPSEVARALNPDELRSLDCSDWREAMDPIRKEAWSMKERRLLDITQKGEVVSGGDLDQIRGPIRLRRIPRD